MADIHTCDLRPGKICVACEIKAYPLSAKVYLCDDVPDEGIASQQARAGYVD